MLVTERVRALSKEGVPLEEQAVLVRTNARAADFEEAFHEAGIAFQGASLLARDAARRLLKALRDGSATDVARTVRVLADEHGYLPSPPEKLGEGHKWGDGARARDPVSRDHERRAGACQELGGARDRRRVGP